LVIGTDQFYPLAGISIIECHCYYASKILIPMVKGYILICLRS